MSRSWRFHIGAMFLILAMAVIPAAHASASGKQVLVLHSYHQGFAWTDDVMAGMSEGLKNAGPDLGIHVEYMDTKRHPPFASFDLLESHYQQKYKKITFDLILLSDNNALEFLISRQDRLFPDVPIVFCGINNFTISMLEQISRITGITEEIDITGTIETAARLFPDMDTFYVINDQTPTGNANRIRMERAAAEMAAKGFSFSFMDGLSVEELGKTLSGISPPAGILLFTFHRDNTGRALSIHEYLSLVRNHARVPVFSFWQHYMGQGILGGKLVNGYEQGSRAAAYAVRILDGEKPSDLPILIKSPNVTMLDERELQRFGVDKAKLPQEAVVLYNPVSVMDTYRIILIISGIFTVLLAILSTVLTLQGRSRKKALASLKASEAKYRGFVNTTTDLVWFMDASGTLTDVNQTVTPLLGYSQDEIRGMKTLDLLNEQSIDRARQIFQQSVSRETGWSGVRLKWNHKNGSIRIFESAAQPVFNNQNQLIGFSGIERDITQRRQAEIALRQNEEKYRRIFENSVVGFFQSTPEGRFIGVNKAMARMFRYDSPEDLMETVTDISTQYYVNPEDRYKYQVILSDTGKIDGFEFKARCKDNTEIWISNSTRAYFDKAGKVTHYEGVVQEITKRKVAEEALEKRVITLTRPLDTDNAPVSFEELFSLDDIQKLQDEFARAVGVASIITDPNGIPITRPSNFTRLCMEIIRKTETGLKNCFKSDAAMGNTTISGPVIQRCKSGGLWDAGAVIRVQGTHIANWLIGQVRNEVQKEDEMLVYAREIGADEQAFIEAFREVPAMSMARFEQVAQTLYTLANQLSTMAFQNVQQARLISALTKAETEQKELQSQLTQAQKMESVGRLAGGVAHDFNNMLSIITGNTDLIMEDLAPEHPFSEGLEEIRKAAQRSTDLTRQLLAFARKQTIFPKVIDLNHTIEGMLKMLRRLIGEEVYLTWQPGQSLWPVLIDPSQVDQILANLCVNARDAIQGIGIITIETANISFDETYCRLHQEFLPGQFVMLTISDDGAGMDKETLENLFEPFFTTKDVGQGTGLGLAMVYGIVKQNKGFVNVYSEPGQGSTFKLYLPRHRVEGVENETTSPAAPARGKGEIILLVEDEAAILRMTARLLENLGYTVISASTPEQALHFSREFDNGGIQLLMTDVIMPDMNGRDLASQILLKHTDLKLLFVSGYTEEIIAHHGVLEKGVNFLSKPFSKQDLAAKLREILEA